MGLLEISKCHKYLLVAFVLYFLSSCNVDSSKYPEICIDSIESNIVINNSTSNWEYGYGCLNFKSDSAFICYVYNEESIKVHSYRDSLFGKSIPLGENFLSFYCLDSSLFVVFESKLEKYTFDNQLNYDKAVIKHPVIFRDSLYLFSYIYSGIVPINRKKFLAPYRIENNSANLVDTFAYLLLAEQDSTMIAKSKLVLYPSNYSEMFEYLKLPIAVYSENSNSLFYTFQKANQVYKLNLDTQKLDSVALPGYQAIAFEQSKQRDIGYLRKYMMANDYNYKIFADNADKIYLLKKCAGQNDNRYELVIFNEEFKILSRRILQQPLVAEVSFIMKNRLYVKGSSNCFYTYSLAN